MTQDPFAPRPGQPPSAGYGSTPGGWGPPPTPYDVGHGGPAPTSLEPKAWIALLCAVLAYTPTVPFLGAIAALILARSARRDILASGGRLTGLSLCTWATVLSWVHLVFVGLLLLLFLVLLAAGVALPFL